MVKRAAKVAAWLGRQLRKLGLFSNPAYAPYAMVNGRVRLSVRFCVSTAECEERSTVGNRVEMLDLSGETCIRHFDKQVEPW